MAEICEILSAVRAVLRFALAVGSTRFEARATSSNSGASARRSHAERQTGTGLCCSRKRQRQCIKHGILRPSAAYYGHGLPGGRLGGRPSFATACQTRLKLLENLAFRRMWLSEPPVPTKRMRCHVFFPARIGESSNRDQVSPEKVAPNRTPARNS